MYTVCYFFSGDRRFFYDVKARDFAEALEFAGLLLVQAVGLPSDEAMKVEVCRTDRI